MATPRSTKGIGRHSHIRDTATPRLEDRGTIDPSTIPDHQVGDGPHLRVVAPQDTPLGSEEEILFRRLAQIGQSLNRFPQWRVEAYLDIELTPDVLEDIATAMLEVSGELAESDDEEESDLEDSEESD